MEPEMLIKLDEKWPQMRKTGSQTCLMYRELNIYDDVARKSEELLNVFKNSCYTFCKKINNITTCISLVYIRNCNMK